MTLDFAAPGGVLCACLPDHNGLFAATSDELQARPGQGQQAAQQRRSRFHGGEGVMAKLSAHGAEVFRCFDPRRRILKAYMSDGTILARSVFSGWKRYGKIKEGRTVHEVVDNIIARVSQALRDGKGNYGWILKVDHLPSVKSLERWANADLVPTPTGYEVEPDGVGPDGVPSWLRILGMI